MDLEFHEKLNKHKADGKSFVTISRRVRINAIIAEYYERLGEEYEDLLKTRGGITKEFKPLTSKRAGRLLRCGRFIDTTRFKELGIHKINAIKLCGDKFCGNCQKRLANERERKYTPLLQELERLFDVYHIVLTVPNVPELFLTKSVEDIIKAFAKLIKYVKGDKKIRGINFGGFGYVGAFRSLEITHNVKRDDYHPHLHCIFVLKKGLNLDQPKVFTNAFSFSNGRRVSQWSAFEVFIQKLWKLCYSGERVTKSGIDLSDGYSCMVNRANGNYHQIFKYVVKGLLDDKHEQQRRAKTGRIDNGLTYEEFRALYFALEGRRAMQAYGCFQGLKLDETVLTDSDKTNEEIRAIISELRKYEPDEFVSEKLATVIENIVKNHEIYISAKDLKDDLEGLKEE